MHVHLQPDFLEFWRDSDTKPTLEPIGTRGADQRACQKPTKHNSNPQLLLPQTKHCQKMFGITRSIATPLRRATLAFAPAAIATACARTMASKTLFVGNLTWTARSEDLATLFGEYGDVHSVRIMTDRDTGRSRGFGFIEMAEEAAEKAVAELDGKDFRGRDLRVCANLPTHRIFCNFLTVPCLPLTLTG